MTATPATAIPIASHVLRATGSPRNDPIAAARIGASAWKKSTFATEAWFSATRNEPEESASRTTIAIPPRPVARNACASPPRSDSVTQASSPIAANTARPATCVAVETDSSRWNRPADDHATAASATNNRPRWAMVMNENQ
jgi:hypothetical protein